MLNHKQRMPPCAHVPLSYIATPLESGRWKLISRTLHVLALNGALSGKVKSTDGKCVLFLSMLYMVLIHTKCNAGSVKAVSRAFSNADVSVKQVSWFQTTGRHRFGGCVFLLTANMMCIRQCVCGTISSLQWQERILWSVFSRWIQLGFFGQSTRSKDYSMHDAPYHVGQIGRQRLAS